MKKSPLYTRTGDKGTTALVDGSRVAKNSPRVCAYGSIDELNAFIGLLRCHIAPVAPDREAVVAMVSNTLFNIGGCLATPATETDNSLALSLLGDIDPRIAELEREIDLLDSEVEPLRCFVLPGGCEAAAHAHVARAVCRRAERDILTLADTGAFIPPALLTFINRLSDYLFILARYLNHLTAHPDIPWEK